MERSTGASVNAAPSRLGVDDWLRAAFEILIEEGIAGVKIPRLCERLGVTKGSFYWHFTDLDAFYDALIARYSAEATKLPVALGADGETGVDEVLLDAMHVFADRRNRELTRAMRTWGETDPRAAKAIRAADRILLQRVTEAMGHLGFEPEEAEVRAKILYYAGIGFAHVGSLGHRSTPEEELAATWRIITRR